MVGEGGGGGVEREWARLGAGVAFGGGAGGVGFRVGEVEEVEDPNVAVDAVAGWRVGLGRSGGSGSLGESRERLLLLMLMLLLLHHLDVITGAHCSLLVFVGAAAGYHWRVF